MKALSKFVGVNLNYKRMGEDMQFGNIKNLDNLSIYPRAIQRAIEYLKETDFSTKEVGSYEVEGKKLFFQVVDTETGEIEERQAEIHRNYIDIHYSLEGNETIGFVVDNGNNAVKEDLLEEKDILFYEGVENENFVRMVPGSFAIFYPTDVHRPNCSEKETRKIRKVIAKVSVELL